MSYPFYCNPRIFSFAVRSNTSLYLNDHLIWNCHIPITHHPSHHQHCHSLLSFKSTVVYPFRINVLYINHFVGRKKLNGTWHVYIGSEIVWFFFSSFLSFHSFLYICLKLNFFITIFSHHIELPSIPAFAFV